MTTVIRAWLVPSICFIGCFDPHTDLSSASSGETSEPLVTTAADTAAFTTSSSGHSTTTGELSEGTTGDPSDIPSESTTGEPIVAVTGTNNDPSACEDSDACEAGGSAAASGGATASGDGNPMGGGVSISGGAASGGGGSGECEIGTTQGNEVLFIGESFTAASTIPEETTNLARAAGSLAANDSYVDVSVSGTWIGSGTPTSIPNQYRDNADGVRFVLMNGGGNDCWQGGQESHLTAALNAASELFEDMDENGVEKIVYFFYPDPIGNQFASLTACLDLLRPDMKALCDGLTSPECHWVDLRDTWDGHPEYTSDGIHVASPGNVPTATAIFESMQENCVAP